MMEYSLFGESHGKVVGVLIKHVPAGIDVENSDLALDLLRRKGSSNLSTARKEEDEVEYLSGIFEGKTTGMPVVAVIYNKDVKDEDYDSLRGRARPGHADYVAYVKSDGYNDPRGGGHISGRLTAPLVVAGSLAKSFLQQFGIQIQAEIVEEAQLLERAEKAKEEGDSVGGQIRCTVTGMPVGIGGPDLEDCLESEIARQVFAIPAVKAIGFGEGENFANLKGSEANDALAIENGKIHHETNHTGGINGGISNGEEITFTVTFRPTPSIAKSQQTVDLNTKENVEINATGRHDSCIVLRAAPVVEAATAIALSQFFESRSLSGMREELDMIDEKIVRLIEERFAVVERIGQLKKAANLPVYDAEREKQVLASRKEMASKYSDEIEELYQKIMELAKGLEV